MSFQTAFSHAQMQLQATNKETTKQTFMAPEIKKTPPIMTPSKGINNIKSERRTLTSSDHLGNGSMCYIQGTSTQYCSHMYHTYKNCHY